METTDISRDKLISDMKVVIADADELLRATAGQAGEKVAAARARIQDSMDAARIKLAQLSEAGAEKAKAAARDRKSTRLNSSHSDRSRMPSSA